MEKIPEGILLKRNDHDDLLVWNSVTNAVMLARQAGDRRLSHRIDSSQEGVQTDPSVVIAVLISGLSPEISGRAVRVDLETRLRGTASGVEAVVIRDDEAPIVLEMLRASEDRAREARAVIVPTNGVADAISSIEAQYSATT